MNRPSCFLEFSAYRSVAIELLDGELREYLDCSFQEMSPNRLFLARARVPEYHGDQFDAFRATVHYFKTTGSVVIDYYESHPGGGVGSRIVGNEEHQVDVTSNWVPYPTFGQYEQLVKAARGVTLLGQRSNDGLG
jgi:hypothetical protein